MLLWFIYSFVQEALFGATFGKITMRLRVVKTDGQHLTWLNALIRNLMRPVDYLYCIGAFAILLSPRRQRPGDKLAGTLVVDNASVPFTPRSPAELRRSGLVVLASLTLFATFCVGFSYYGRPPMLIEKWSQEFRPFQQRISSYTLNSPSWGSGTVTYPIQMKLDGSRDTCSATVILEWADFFKGGWCSIHGLALCLGKTHSFSLSTSTCTY